MDFAIVSLDNQVKFRANWGNMSIWTLTRVVVDFWYRISEAVIEHENQWRDARNVLCVAIKETHKRQEVWLRFKN